MAVVGRLARQLGLAFGKSPTPTTSSSNWRFIRSPVVLQLPPSMSNIDRRSASWGVSSVAAGKAPLRANKQPQPHAFFPMRDVSGIPGDSIKM